MGTPFEERSAFAGVLRDCALLACAQATTVTKTRAAAPALMAWGSPG
ncbi:hypothetical protein AKJ09_04741 [Labilithrix luteola]|uniref:Uncharacterized protein n=1 Tax=Labilithrix luteola TaxID=1391654 RepID=A0A0K1PX34_9BACT|nr:hypothetical protein AKJ09_04741 [Labilithrix luteola]